MIKSRDTHEARRQLDRAIQENDLPKVKELIESGEAVVTNIHFVGAVHANSKEILEYFLEREVDTIAVISLGLDIAIQDKNFKFIEMIVRALRDNKNSKNFHKDVDSVIAMAIYKVGYCYSEHILNEEEMFKYTKAILDIYCQ